MGIARVQRHPTRRRGGSYTFHQLVTLKNGQNWGVKKGATIGLFEKMSFIYNRARVPDHPKKCHKGRHCGLFDIWMMFKIPLRRTSLQVPMMIIWSLLDAMKTP